MFIAKDVKQNVLDIVSLASYEFIITMYGQDGKKTLITDDCKWLFIKPDNLLIRFPDYNDEQRNEIFIWKSGDTFPKKLKRIVKRIRYVCKLNGLGMTIKNYNKKFTKKILPRIIDREKPNPLDEAYANYANEINKLFESNNHETP